MGCYGTYKAIVLLQREAAKHSRIAMRNRELLIDARRNYEPEDNGLLIGPYGNSKKSNGWFYEPRVRRNIITHSIKAREMYESARALL